MTRDILDCLHEYRALIGPVNALESYINAAIKLASEFQGFVDLSVMRNVFKQMGQCNELTLNPDSLDFLGEYYLVRYKNNIKGESGPQFECSSNYTLLEYSNKLLFGSSEAMDYVNSNHILEELQTGLTESPLIIAIKDSTINLGLILDGARRLLALIYLKKTKPDMYKSLEFSKYPIKFCSMTSPIARAIFPLDFWKLTYLE